MGTSQDAPSSRRRGRALLVVVLLAALVAAAVLLVLRPWQDEQTRERSSSAPGPRSARTAQQAVRLYLQAIADGDAERALRLSASRPADRRMLTATTLATSRDLAPITRITVSEPVAGGARVPASYSVGGKRVETSVRVTRAGRDFVVADAAAQVDLDRLGGARIPVVVGDRQIGRGPVMLFPGAYRVRLDSTRVGLRPESPLYVENSDGDLTPRLRLSVTPSGRRAFVHAVRLSLTQCLRRRSLHPPRCPNVVRRGPFRVEAGTIRWRLLGDPWTRMRVRPVHGRPGVAYSSTRLTMRVGAKCRDASGSGDCEMTVAAVRRPFVDLTRSPLVVRWRR